MAIKDDKKQKESLIKSKKRVKKFGEVFTPEFIVKRMCDLYDPTVSQVDKKSLSQTTPIIIQRFQSINAINLLIIANI